MTSQIVPSVFASSSLRILAPTNGFSNILDFCACHKVHQKVIKMQIHTGRPILHTFWPPKIKQKLQQQKISGSPKLTFSSERCRKNQFWHSHAAWESFFFLIRTQRWSAKNNFCDTSPARMRFFSFFRHLPSGKLKNHENAPLEPPCRRHVAKDAIRKSLPK